MKLLKWKRKRTSTNSGSIVEPAAVQFLSAGGNSIVPDWHNDWKTDSCGFHEIRRHVGLSVDGFHAGVEVCYRAAMGQIEWSDARRSPELAQCLSAQMTSDRRDAITGCVAGRTRIIDSGKVIQAYLNRSVEDALVELHEAVARIEMSGAALSASDCSELENAVENVREALGEVVRRTAATCAAVL